MLGESVRMVEGVEVPADPGTPIPIAAVRAIMQKHRTDSNQTITFDMLESLFESYGAQGAFYVLGIADHA